MQVPHGEGVTHHPDPESCAGRREAAGEALTGENAGQCWRRGKTEPWCRRHYEPALKTQTPTAVRLPEPAALAH